MCMYIILCWYIFLWLKQKIRLVISYFYKKYKIVRVIMLIVLLQFLNCGVSLRGFPSRLDYYYYLSSVILSDGWRIKVNEIVGQHNVPRRDLRDWLMTVYWRPPVIHQWQMINSPLSPQYYILRLHKLHQYIYL